MELEVFRIVFFVYVERIVLGWFLRLVFFVGEKRGGGADMGEKLVFNCVKIILVLRFFIRFEVSSFWS